MNRTLLSSSCVALFLLFALLLTERDASAADDQQAEAGRLFERGRALMQEKRFDEACPLLARSQDLDPADGTLLALGLCHEQTAAYVRAWTELDEALAKTTASGREDRQRVARAALGRVTPKVGRVIVQTKGGDPSAAKYEIRKDGLVLVKPTLGRELAVEPGAHAVQLRTGDRVIWETQLTVFSGAVNTVVIPIPADPSLSPYPSPSPSPSPITFMKPTDDIPEATKPRSTSSALRYGSYGLMGTGGASLIAGGIFGGLAYSAWSDVEGRCNPKACADRGALSDAESANNAATVSNVLLVTGAVLLAVGIVTYLEPWKAPSKSTMTAGRRSSSLPARSR